MPVLVNLSIPEQHKTYIIEYEDMDVSEEEWKQMSKEEKKQKIEDFVSGFDPAYWEIDEFNDEEE